ncbi:MAG TPA: hypothetical protein VGU44_04305, partial [Gammaproteobacteria bacterium]|nr:hypothetical protein [Gammaproteobacteria bacterium]
RKSHYTWAEKRQIINQLSYLNNSQENLPDDFYKKLWAFVEGMNVFTEKLSKTSDIHYFKDLSEWVKMILDNFVSLEDRDQAELGEFSEYGREHSDSSVVITFYEEMHRSSKLDTLNRLCNGIEIYVLLKKLHQLSDKEINPEEIKALYKSLMMALHKAGKLTDPLRRELNREAQAGEFDSLGHIYEIFRGMLKEDKSDLLLDYLPKKESLGPTESFVRVLERNTAPQAIGNMQFAYQQLMAEMRLETLKRAGAAIGLFVALSNLEKVRTESRSTDEHYPDAKLKEDRSSQIETVYSELILALKVAGLLTDKLDKTLVVEMSACLDAVKQNPRAELELKSLAQCHADLKRMLRKDTVCILADYVPRDKDLYLSNESFDPQKPFYQFLVEDYFNKVNVGQATVLN